MRWISKASSLQRAGRAGRTGPGHCYRLFSSAHFNDTFPEHTPPEIMNTALEGVVLLMKSMGVDKVGVEKVWTLFTLPPLPKHTSPEILDTALEGVVPLIKSMGVDRLGVGAWYGRVVDHNLLCCPPPPPGAQLSLPHSS